MKNHALLLFAVSLFFSGCSKQSQTLVVKNPTDLDLSYKLVEVPRQRLQAVFGQWPTVSTTSGETIPSQLIDNDADGDWDKLIFQLSLNAGQYRELEIDWVNEENYPEYKKQTQVYLGYSQNRNGTFTSVSQNQRTSKHSPQKPPYTYQFEGPGWESNLVAFRSYFDTRNGKDIYGKTTQEMVTHQIGTGEDYHTLQDWGMDVLKVGTSLGAGALAVLKGDSIIRLGATDSATFEKLQEGPVCSTFSLSYQGWDVAGTPYNLEERITIYANKRWYKSEVIIPSHTSDTLLTGIVNLKGAQVKQVSVPDFEILFTHGKQSENGDNLGMALMIPSASSIGFNSAPVEGTGVTNTEIAKLSSVNDQYTFYFYAGWELENPIFKEQASFEAEVKRATQSIAVELILE